MILSFLLASGGGLQACICFWCAGAGAGHCWDSGDRLEWLEEQHGVQRRCVLPGMNAARTGCACDMEFPRRMSTQTTVYLSHFVITKCQAGRTERGLITWTARTGFLYSVVSGVDKMKNPCLHLNYFPWSIVITLQVRFTNVISFILSLMRL